MSLFSGCGGFDLGASRAGVEITWANDIDRQAVAAHRKLVSGAELVEGDVREVGDLPRADIMIGCYPCIGFSLAARRGWRDRKRDLCKNGTNFLYREFLRLLRIVKAKYFLVENVGGMRSAEGGWFLKNQLSGFRRHGYKATSAVLNAADYGVPQSRERLFIVGVTREETDFDYAFPEPTHGPARKRHYAVLRDAIGAMEEWPVGEFFDYPFHGHYLTRNRKRAWGELSYTIVADAHHVTLHPMGEPMKFIKKDEWALQGDKNRRLSWRECAVLQGLPQDGFESGSLRERYRVIGNAVPPALAEAIIKPIVDFESAG